MSLRPHIVPHFASLPGLVITAAHEACSWLSMATPTHPPQETREQSSSLALPLCPEEKGWQSLCLLRLCSWCQHKTPGGTPAHTFSPGREVESHDYRQTPPSKRSRNKATALPVRTTVTEVNIPERFVSRASKLSQELTERILHPSGSGWQEHFPLGPHIFSVFASPQKHHL